MPTTRHRALISFFAWANLLAQIGIITTGGAVRLTGSGLGCSTWPNCEPGQFTPEFRAATSLHPFIEFGNRTLAGVVLACALGLFLLLWAAHRRRLTPGRSTTLIGLAAAIVLIVIGQAVLGGMTVWFELHPALVGSHFGISGILVTLSTYLLLRWREGDGEPRLPDITNRNALRPLAWALGVLAAAVVVIGVIVTGAGPHSGDADVGYRFDVDPLTMARVHAGLAWAFSAAVVTLLVVLLRARPLPGGQLGAAQPVLAAPSGTGGAETAVAAPTAHSAPSATRAGHELRRARRRAVVLAGVTLAQGAIGYVQYFTGLPELIVGFHLFGAAVLIAAVTAAIMALRVRD
ncbi:MAG TPA: COX15/CtaA family protein [Beutenbergiaceae bacterium]|nr:COX15/CtaA family protein [Beutenbergiaceae bacterium]